MVSLENLHSPILVRGTGDIASAVAVQLFRAGYAVLLHDEPAPTALRRGMAFTDAVFDGIAMLDGIDARLVDVSPALHGALIARNSVLVTVAAFADVLASADWSALIDSRMRKRATPELQRGLAPLTIGIGPNFVAGETVDFAIETSLGERMGAIIQSGATMALAGEPESLGGAGRERFIYAPIAGCVRTAARIGAVVASGDVVATIGDVPLSAPLTGVIRGLVHADVFVTSGMKVVEIDPRGDQATAFGLGERPRRIADGVHQALTNAAS